MSYINVLRYADSDYVVTTTTYQQIQEQIQDGRDPTGLFHNITSYDLFVWMHYYASREAIHPDNHTDVGIDFAHEGQGFASWHRLFLLVWEKRIQEVNQDEDFTLPYWDWPKNKDTCEICTEDLLEVTKEDGNVKGKYFRDWYTICTAEQTHGMTQMCHPANKKPGLERLKDSDKKKKEEKGYRMTFPTKEEVNFVLRFKTFDLPPYSKESSCNFRNILEGFVNTSIGYRLPNAHSLHNQVHVVIGGTMGVTPSASNDPIFPLHRAFTDRIYEKWLRMYNKDASALSRYDAPICHNRGGVIIPLFPVYTHEQIFKKSFEFGYDYEDLDEDGNSSDDDDSSPSSLGLCPAVSASETAPAADTVENCMPWKIVAGSFAGVLFFLLFTILTIVIYYSCKPSEQAELQQLIPIKVTEDT